MKKKFQFKFVNLNPYFTCSEIDIFCLTSKVRETDFGVVTLN